MCIKLLISLKGLWFEISGQQLNALKQQFNTLCELMYKFFSIPCSNDDSILHFEKNSHRLEAIITLKTMKFNCNDCCQDILYEV